MNWVFRVELFFGRRWASKVGTVGLHVGRYWLLFGNFFVLRFMLQAILEIHCFN